MKKHAILNAELNHALASMGHGDMLIVCDAGFPIPRSAWRIDLAVCRDLPEIAPVLRAIMEDFCVEKIAYGQEVCDYNSGLHEDLKTIFSGVPHEHIPHAMIMEELVHKAKVVVRTGAFNPW